MRNPFELLVRLIQGIPKVLYDNAFALGFLQK